MFRPLNKGAVTTSEAVSGKGGSDALLRALQGARLEEWTALRLLHENTHPGIQDYICNRLPELGEATIERYLLQFVYLAVNKPGQHLERILLNLCKHSFRVAIKAQWLLVALCQDHPRSRALESFRDQANKAALEGKWEVPIRTAKLDPLSPHNSQQLSPPFCSPTSSYMAAHLANANHIGREALPSQPYRLPNVAYPDDSVATQPPGSMVMSPPGAANATNLGCATKQAADHDASAPAPLQRKRSGAMQTLGCLLPAEQRGGTTSAATLTVPASQLQLQPKAIQAVDARPPWFDDKGVETLASAIKTSACVTPRNVEVSASGDAPASAPGGDVAIATAATSGAVAAPAAVPTANGPTSAGGASTATGAIAAAAGRGRPTVTPPCGPPGMTAAASAVSILERIQALKRELGEGERVSALLERVKQQGMAPVATMEEDALLSDDELSNRPMSPLSQLRFDTFGATLDFVEALCDASSSLTNYSQEVRHNALRLALEHINQEIERANRREVAIWFPMGRRGDRVLRLAAREAVLLNSREKAPFLLIVEVLEGQNECGDDVGGTDAFDGLSTAASSKAGLDSLNLAGLSASTMAPSPAQKVEFGRRETYGIALTGLGAQHQQQYMHSTPGAVAATAAASFKVPAEAGKQHGGLDKRNEIGGVARGSSGRPSLDAAAAAVSAPRERATGDDVQPNGCIQSRSDVLVSPTPTRATSATQAALLDELAAAAAAAVAMARRSAAETGTEATATGPFANGPGASRRSSGPGSGPSPAPGLSIAAPSAPVAVPQQAATEVVIPTRSVSSNNIAAAAAAAAAAAMTASASGGGATADSILSTSCRSSDAGAGGNGSSLSGPQPLTPRSVSSLSGLPPRPPSSLVAAVPPPLQPPPPPPQHHPLPLGGISPVNAAKEVSASDVGQESGGLLAASNLLRRVIGDRAEEAAAAAAGEDQPSTGGDDSVVRSLDGKFGAVEPKRWGPIASAAATASISPTTVAAALEVGSSPLMPHLTRQVPTGSNAARSGHVAALPSLLISSHLADGRMQEFGPTGLFGPHSGIKSGPEVMAMLSDISASLRGEMPMVRVRIVPVGTNGVAVASGANGSNTGSGPMAFSLATLGSRAKAALLNQQSQLQPQPAASDDASEGGQSKTALLLSRLGWCRKPSAEVEASDTGAGAAAAAAGTVPPTAGAAATVPEHGGASQVTIPVTSGGVFGGGGLLAGGKRLPGSTPRGAEQLLVRLILSVATKSVNLEIKSPHRKSRRTPSHEAIEMMADKYKIHTLPPPPECGPPLLPGPYGSFHGVMDRVLERTSEDEAEDTGGEATATAQKAAATPPQAPGSAPVVLPLNAPPSQVSTCEGNAASRGQPLVNGAVAGTKTVVLDPPLPPGWESRSGTTAAAQPLAVVKAVPFQLSARPHNGDAANGHEKWKMPSSLSPSTAAVSHPSLAAECRKSTTAVAVAEAAMQQRPDVAAGGTHAVQSAVIALPQALGSYGEHVSGRPMGLPEKLAPPSDKIASALDATGGTGVLAAGLQSITRILNRSAGSSQQQQQQVSVGECASAAIAAGACSTGDSESVRQPSSVPGAIPAAAAAAAMGPELSAVDASPTDASWGGDAGAKAQSQQLQPRLGGAENTEAAVGTAGPTSGIAASLQSITRILSRSTVGPAPGAAQVHQQQPPTPPLASDQGTTSAVPNAGASGTAGPRGVSPIRNSGGGGGGGSQPLAPGLVATAHPGTAVQPQPRTGFLEGGSAASAAPPPVGGSALAASFHSITRILNRSAAGPQQQPAAESAAAAATASVSSASGGSGGNAPAGPSPRGVSPVRGNTGSSGNGGALSKLLSRMQPEQQPQPQSSSPLNPNSVPTQQQPHQQQQGRQVSQGSGREPAAAAPAPSQLLPYSLPKVTEGRYERESLEERRRREARAVYGERWAAKVKRIQRESPHGRRQGWALRCVIVKSGDDCRQELLALQLVRTFGDIFSEAGLPLWVRYYEVLVTSNKTALIEMVPNTLSIHTIKSRSSPGTSLSDHFFAKFGRSGTPECTAAQRRFTESLAAYSLICYLLQIKDRHNGNILIDDDGRVVHIDYGFLLSNSPGGVNFESAPFKLTRELLEVMDSNSDGRPSEMFDYFKVLMIQGFIAARNCSDRILLLTKVMSKSGFPCFKGGERAFKALEKRLMTSLTEVQCVEHVLQLIAESLDAWRTRQYDYYQRVLNGIL